MRGKTYTDGNTVARVCNGNRAVIIYGKLGNRFISERRMGRIIRRLRGLVVEEDDKGHRVALKEVRFKEHFMRRNQSYGISLNVVQELNKMQVDGIELHVTDEGQVLYCDMDDFNRLSTIERYPPFEEQAFLHISKWKRL